MSNVDTPPMPDAIRRIADSTDRQLAWQFFVFFARFEYALKRCTKYLKRSVEPNWDRFSSDHDVEFRRHASAALTSAIEYFKKFPPQKQQQVDGQLTWSAPKGYDERDPLLVWLLIAVRGVRNNLFHGGKFPGFPVSDPSRDRDLIGNAIVILDACLKLDTQVRGKFLAGIED
jgi:hypothetical protein